MADWARAAGTSAICIAPLPMIAPPQVQAHSLARAIRTDIDFSLSRCGCARRFAAVPSTGCKRPKLCERGNCVNRVCLSDSGICLPESTLNSITVPNQDVNGFKPALSVKF